MERSAVDKEALSFCPTINEYPFPISEELIAGLNLIPLVAQALHVGDPIILAEIARNGLMDDDPRQSLFVAEAEGKAISLIKIDRWSFEDGMDEWGPHFLAWVNYFNPKLKDQISRKTDLIISINGVVTLLDCRRQGLQDKIWDRIVEKYNPGIILGDTQEPAAVVSRSRALSDRYITFFDTNAIGNDNSDSNSEIIRVVNDVCIALKWGNRRERLISSDDGTVTTEISDLEGFSPDVAQAFKRAIEKQTKFNNRGRHVGLTFPLISIRKDLLS